MLPERAVGVESLSLPALPPPLTNTLSLDLKEPFPCDSHIRRARSVQGGEERAWGLEQARDVLVSVLYMSTSISPSVKWEGKTGAPVPPRCFMLDLITSRLRIALPHRLDHFLLETITFQSPVSPKALAVNTALTVIMIPGLSSTVN